MIYTIYDLYNSEREGNGKDMIKGNMGERRRENKRDMRENNRIEK